jgi:hypothetical protein
VEGWRGGGVEGWRRRDRGEGGLGGEEIVQIIRVCVIFGDLLSSFRCQCAI